MLVYARHKTNGRGNARDQLCVQQWYCLQQLLNGLQVGQTTAGLRRSNK